ncbi:DUF397 domain-containing protein [Streptomyces xiamenensis]|uniref:DUF397 domain-containing protein n=1 Tax=Streptomyces xiamenensis TaxID=408015 RepID=UPI0036A4648D
MSTGATGLAWFKSSYSGSQGDDCVEIAITEQAIHVRDSKDPTHPPFTISPPAWLPFVRFATRH